MHMGKTVEEYCHIMYPYEHVQDKVGRAYVYHVGRGAGP